MRNPPLAATLRRIGREGREAFYDGAVMRDIVDRLKALGGLHEEEDFAAQRSNWVEPIHASYRGYDVYECPPNGQGMAALMILRTLAGYALGGDAFSEADRLHLLAEASKAAYWVRDNFICDPEHVSVDVADFLSEARAERTRRDDPARPAPCRGRAGPRSSTRTRSISVSSTATATPARSSTRCSRPSGPAYWRRKAASCCTIAAPASGRSRGHPNAIAPRKRPLHTIIPGMLVKDGRAVMPFGVMGGHYQAVGHAHFIHRLLDRGMDPQQAAEQPRVLAAQRCIAGRASVPQPMIADLAHRGHEIQLQEVPLGGCQAIWIDHAARCPDRRLRAAQGRAGPRLLTAGIAEIGFANANGSTRLDHLYQRDPLRVLFPTPAAHDTALAVIVTTSGGLVAGDQIEVAARVGPGAVGACHSIGSRKIYRSTGPMTAIRQALTVGGGATLEFLPPETILFEGARLWRETSVELRRVRFSGRRHRNLWPPCAGRAIYPRLSAGGLAGPPER